ncbi:response regulator [Methanomassiliicoccus luminyensis]
MLEGYDVVEAENGLRAVQLYAERRPQLVLMDILMPEMDGIEATREILKMDPRAVVIGVSAFASVKGEEMMRAGAKEVLSKPVRMPDLLAKVRSYILVENYGPDSRI